MEKMKEYETCSERKKRERNKLICVEYLDRSSDILDGGTTPQRVLNLIGAKHKLSAYHIKRILIHCGIFGGKEQPVIFPQWYHPQKPFVHVGN